jgi:putative peptidoglycan lipid II flippase
MSEKLIKSTGTVGGMTMLSRFLGYARDVVVASLFGATAGVDMFLLAFRIPNFLRRLFAEGAFSQAFVPVLSEYKANRTPEEVKSLVDHVSGNLGGYRICGDGYRYLAFAGVGIGFAPGYSGDATKLEMTTHMLRITFPYLFFISITALMGGILNTYKKFAVPAVAPVLLNLSIMGGAVLLSPYTADPHYSLAWGVFIGGIAQLLFQIPFLKKIGMLPRFWAYWFDWSNPGVKKILLLMGPAIIGASAMQINLLVDTIFASFLPSGSISWLYYSDRLLEFPIGIFGVALATVVLPHLSEKYATKSVSGFSNSIDWALKWVLLVAVPASLGLMLLAGPILSTLFQRNAFTAQDVYMSQQSLMALSVGLVAFISIKVLVSAFYARQDTKFPVRIAFLSIFSNAIFALLFIGPLKHAGLALASSLASFINVGILLFALIRRGHYQPQSGWLKYGAQLLVANSLMGLFIYFVAPETAEWVEWEQATRFMWLFMLLAGSGVIYFGSLWLSGLRIQHLVTKNA